MSEKSFEVFAAVDINQLCNETYRHNFPDNNCMNNNIQKLKIKDFQSINTILMSPPCQPFSRNGNFKDVDDRRSDALMSICDIVKKHQLANLKYVLMENVVGFEKSVARDIFIDALTSAGFYFQEFIISPSSIGIPNSRNRYYCIARKTEPFSFATSEIVSKTFLFNGALFNNFLLPKLLKIPGLEAAETPSIASFIDNSATDQEFLLSDDILVKRFQVLDICTLDSINSMCFTKSYCRYIEGTGSVLCKMTKDMLKKKICEIEENNGNLEMKKLLKLKFFTPTEVSRLMSFPVEFSFPSNLTNKQRYRLLGNSINVKVVSELIKLLYKR